MRTILGISAFYHDSAAALIVDGIPVAAAQEERFTRKKHDPSFPRNAIAYTLAESDVSPSQVDAVVFYEKPLLKLQRLVATHATLAPKGYETFVSAFTAWTSGKIMQKRQIRRELKALGFPSRCPLLFSSHHESHAASAYFLSPFRRAAVLTMDGVGEWATTTIGVGDASDFRVLLEQRFPHSLGLLYSAFTDFAGFKVNSGEYKLMGLAPYGQPVFEKIIWNNLIDLKEDGSFRLNMKYFDYCVGNRMTNENFAELFGGPARKSEDLLSQREMDLAASIQKVTEEVVFRLARAAKEKTGEKALCLAGGVALNCVANGKLKKQEIFDDIWIQPAAGDAGGALGAALSVYYRNGGARPANGTDLMNGGYLGPQYSDAAVARSLSHLGARFQKLTQAEMIRCTATALAEGKAIGWFQGRMEFGPRALGNRSILADPRSADMQRNLNLKVKFRESFRPFAPAVLLEEVEAWFEYQGESPYMLMVADVLPELRRAMTSDEHELFGIAKLNVPRSTVPAITHVDYSSRLQTVSEEKNPVFHSLIKEFYNITGCPIVVNTSFNVRGEPIVCNPTDAFRCFMGTDLDMLVIENCLLHKSEQPISLRQDYKASFELD